MEVLFVLLWNSGFVGAEVGLPFTGPFTLLLWRYAALSLLLLVALGLAGRLRWPGRRAAGLAGLIGVLAHGVWLGCVLVALEMGVAAGIVALVTALQPLATGALSGPVVGERTSPLQWLGLVLGFVGVVVAVGLRIQSDPSTPVLGYLLPFGSVAAITAASLVQRRLEVTGSEVRLPIGLALLYQSLATTVAVAIPALLAERLATEWTAPFIATMAWLVVAVSLGAYLLMWTLLGRTDATRVASLFYLSPPVTMVMAWIAFGDVVTPGDLVGMAVAAAGIVLVHRR
jgi:drug/metabolite transporter (DMT)-like permease